MGLPVTWFELAEVELFPRPALPLVVLVWLVPWPPFELSSDLELELEPDDV